MESRPRIEVAAAVISNKQGQFLLGQRPPGKPYSGYWEFPGGKLETGELAQAALARELNEELGIEPTLCNRWLTRDFDYPHAAVRLRFFRVLEWSGTLRAREHQALAWQSPDQITVAPLLPANAPILRALRLPAIYGVSQVEALGRDLFMARLTLALERGLRLLVVREKYLGYAPLLELASDVTGLAHRYDAKVMVSGSVEVAANSGADGVHLTALQLMAASNRPACEWCAASCHNPAELERAREIGADFVVLGSVKATPSHPHLTGIGWRRFAHLTKDYPLPVYALGGMRESDLARARHSGAHGVAMMRGAWGAPSGDVTRS